MREVNGRLVIMNEFQEPMKRGLPSRFEIEWDRATAVLKLCGKDLSKIVLAPKKEE